MKGSVPAGQVIVEERLGIELGAPRTNQMAWTGSLPMVGQAMRDGRVDRDRVAGPEHIFVEPTALSRPLRT